MSKCWIRYVPIGWNFQNICKLSSRCVCRITPSRKALLENEQVTYHTQMQENCLGVRWWLAIPMVLPMGHNVFLCREKYEQKYYTLLRMRGRNGEIILPSGTIFCLWSAALNRSIVPRTILSQTWKPNYKIRAKGNGRRVLRVAESRSFCWSRDQKGQTWCTTLKISSRQWFLFSFLHILAYLVHILGTFWICF